MTSGYRNGQQLADPFDEGLRLVRIRHDRSGPSALFGEKGRVGAIAGDQRLDAGETFAVPEAIRPDAAERIMDLADPTRKMSKSSPNPAGRIGLLDPPDVIRRKVARAVTDTVGVVRHDRENQPGVTNLLEILRACTGAQPRTLTSYGELKREVTDAIEAVLTPIRARFAELSEDPGHVRKILADGRARVRPRAEETVRRARAAIGLLD